MVEELMIRINKAFSLMIKAKQQPVLKLNSFEYNNIQQSCLQAVSISPTYRLLFEPFRARFVRYARKWQGLPQPSCVTNG